MRFEHAHDRIIEALDDGAIVHQKCICDARELSERFMLFDSDRVIVDIARRHDEQTSECTREQMLNGR